MDRTTLETGQVVQATPAVPMVDRVVEPVEVTTVPMPAVRAMTRRQRKEMEAAGFNVLDVDNEERAGQTLKMFDWILDNVYADVDLDDYPNGECMRLAADTFRLAMGQPTEEAKNS